jgi:hypothetical protein
MGLSFGGARGGDSGSERTASGSAWEARVWTCRPQSHHVSPKLRALIDHLAAELGPEPEWDGFEVGARAGGRVPS